MDDWPWLRHINPHFDEVSAQSSAWIRGLRAFTAESQDAFDKGNFGVHSSHLESLRYQLTKHTGLFAALAFPTISKGTL